ncbi:MAG TPA: 6-pyruvoyl-tetrahydropterin synthase-related protein [Pyrinomonadaceae bacterium]|jgi:hypothetical protein
MSDVLSKLLENYHLPAIFLASLLLIFPVIVFGYPSGSEDLFHHIQLSLVYFDSINQGVLPDWAGGENSGYGSVAVRFYPPLTHFVMALFRIFAGNWEAAFVLSFFFWSLIGGYGMYLLAADIFKNRLQPTVAAVLFILGHYHVNQIYNSFMFSEFVAVSVFPFCFLFAKKVCERENFLDVLAFGASVSLLILSNTPQTVIGAISIGIFILFYLKSESLFKQIRNLAIGCCLGLLGSCFYWLRMLGEIRWLNIYQPNTDPTYDYRNNFLLTSLDFDDRGIWLVSAMLVALAALLLVSLLITENCKTIFRDRIQKSLFAVFAVSLLLMLPASDLIWEHLHFLQRIQFPWRFLSVASLTATILIAHCFGFFTAENFRSKRPLAMILVGVTFIYCFISIRQIALGANFMDSQRFSRLYEDSRFDKTLKHWQPVWADDKMTDRADRVSAESRRVEIQIWENERRKFSVDEGEKAQMRVACLYYPHWQAFINGKQTAVQRSVDGTVAIDLSNEQSNVELVFVEPEISFISRKISFITWLGIILTLVYGRFRRRNIG